MKKLLILSAALFAMWAIGQTTNDRPVFIGANKLYSNYGGSWAEPTNVALTVGNITLNPASNVTKYAWIPASGLKAKPSGGAEFSERGDFAAWEFIDNQTRSIVANVKLPDDWNGDDDMALCSGWESATTNATSVWAVAWLWTTVGDDTTVACCASTNTFAASDTPNGLVESEMPILTNAAAGDICVHLKVTRLGGDSRDTLGASAWLHGIALKYTSNKP